MLPKDDILPTRIASRKSVYCTEIVTPVWLAAVPHSRTIGMASPLGSPSGICATTWKYPAGCRDCLGSGLPANYFT